MARKSAYSTAQIVLHWLTALCVVTAYLFSEAMEDIARATWDAGGSPFPTPHTIAGFLVVFLVIARLILRARTGAPEPQGTGAAQAAAVWGHRLLYALLLAVPVLGFLTWIVGVQGLGEFHGLLGQAILLVALGHALMALWHQYVKKDGTLTRMLRPGK
jgi:cytochrome b561